MSEKNGPGRPPIGDGVRKDVLVVSIGKELRQKLDKAAAKTGENRSEFVRAAMTDYFLLQDGTQAADSNGENADQALISELEGIAAELETHLQTLVETYKRVVDSVAALKNRQRPPLPACEQEKLLSGLEIKQARQSLRLNQQEFGELVGVHPSWVSQIERGKKGSERALEKIRRGVALEQEKRAGAISLLRPIKEWEQAKRARVEAVRAPWVRC